MDLAAIFKAYDVRGTVPDQLDDEAAHRIGSAFAEFTGARRIAVGHDARTSSPALAEAFMIGVASQGVEVDDLGMITTDMVYHASGVLDEPGAMITASHNPKGYNGIKLCLAGASPVGADTGLGEVRRLAATGGSSAALRGRIHRTDTKERYVEHLLGIVPPDSLGPARVAVDGGNGVAGVVVPPLFARLPVELVGLYLDPDGTFPNHHPDPLRPENLRDIERLMESEPFDLGVAFDGDADRAFFIDDQVESLSGSAVTAMVAEWFLRREPGAAVVYNLICSRAVPETITRAGGTPVRTRVGHSYIKAVMKEAGAVFGGEHSGHYYYRDHYQADSGILTLLVLLRLLGEERRPLSQIRSAYEPYAQSGEVNLAVVDQVAVMEAVERRFPGDHDRLDGLTIDLGHRWFNLRPSNTEPMLRLNVEGPDRPGVDELVHAITQTIEEVTDAPAR
jgi:phosphomannomutase